MNKSDYAGMQAKFNELFDQALTEAEIEGKKGGLIGDEGMPLGRYIWTEDNSAIEYYVHWIPHYLGDSHGIIHKDGIHERLPTLTNFGPITPQETNLQHELVKKGLK